MGRLSRTSIFFVAGFLFITLFSVETFSADLSMHGYYRNRYVGTGDLDLQKEKAGVVYPNNRFGLIQFNQMRLRLEPTFKLNDFLSLQAQFDVLDNILFGSNQTRQLNIIAPLVGQQSLPAGGGSILMTGPSTVGENGALNVRRVWADILSPIGKFRIGRQPSHWGLGIFQNDGNELQGNYGDTADRVLYLLQYDVADVGAITGGLLWDIAYEAQFDPNITLLNTSPQSNSRDCQQYAGMFMFERPEFAAGAFGGLRRRNGPDGGTTMTVTDALGNSTAAGIDGDTMMYFADIYGRYNFPNHSIKFEGVYLGGKVTTGLALNAIPFAGLGAGQGIIQLPAKQSIRVFMAAMEAAGHYETGDEWLFQTGYAEGDGTPLSNRITMYGFRPDYQIALIMFYMPLGTTPSLYGQKAGGSGGTEYLAGAKSITSNYINNALYFSLGYKHKFDLSSTTFAEWAKVGTKVTTAWAPQTNMSINLQDLIPQTGNWPTLSERASSMWKRWYGIEIDVAGETMLFENLYTALEGGVLIPGRAYDIDVNLIDPGSIVEPIAKDTADIAWLVRLTASILF